MWLAFVACDIDGFAAMVPMLVHVATWLHVTSGPTGQKPKSMMHNGKWTAFAVIVVITSQFAC